MCADYVKRGLRYLEIVLDWISISLYRDTLATTHEMSPNEVAKLSR